jgi:hypothetical protein
MPVKITPLKRCTMCGETKDRATEFSRAGKYVLACCKPCAAVRAAEWRKANPGRGVEWRRQDRLKNPEKYRQFDRDRYAKSPAVKAFRAARDNPCVDCGVALPPEVMELDHVRGEKLFSIGGPKLRCRPLPGVLSEIAKCDVRCPNCHKLRHHYERQRQDAA